MTALTAQNSQGVDDVHPVPPEFVGEQIRSVTVDFDVRATKTGMIFNEPIIKEVVSHRDRLGKLIVDPVMFAASGDSLLETEAEVSLARELIPRADVVTPNWHEARQLAGLIEVDQRNDPETVGRELAREWDGPHVLIKGGHTDDDEAVDRLVTPDGSIETFVAPRLDTENTHGAGCAYSSLITGHLVGNKTLMDSVADAKKQLTTALEKGYACGEGAGTLNFLNE